jgi:hypothetical protein
MDILGLWRSSGFACKSWVLLGAFQASKVALKHPQKHNFSFTKLPLPSLTQLPTKKEIFDKHKIVFKQNNVQTQFFLYIYQMK